VCPICRDGHEAQHPLCVSRFEMLAIIKRSNVTAANSFSCVHKLQRWEDVEDVEDSTDDEDEPPHIQAVMGPIQTDDGQTLEVGDLVTSRPMDNIIPPLQDGQRHPINHFARVNGEIHAALLVSDVTHMIPVRVLRAV
jgi:hypothetical protein